MDSSDKESEIESVCSEADSNIESVCSEEEDCEPEMQDIENEKMETDGDEEEEDSEATTASGEYVGKKDYILVASTQRLMRCQFRKTI